MLLSDCFSGIAYEEDKGRDWGNCVLTADCVRGIGHGVGREGIVGIVC